MAAYSFTSPKIAKALVDAHKRGVQVRAVLDKSQLSERYSGATFLANAGVPVRIDSRYAIIVLRERPRHSCRGGIARHAKRAPSSRILRLACYLYTGRVYYVNGSQARLPIPVLPDP